MGVDQQTKKQIKMKKYFFLTLTLILFGVVSAGLVACGGDDEESSERDQRFVGTWNETHKGNLVVGLRFNANGTCVLGEWRAGGAERFNAKNEAQTFWSTNGSTLTISSPDAEINEDWGGSYAYTISPDGLTLVLVGITNDEWEGTYTKVK